MISASMVMKVGLVEVRCVVTLRRYSEWSVWNAAALTFWLALIIDRPDIWPMLLLLLPLQFAVNVVVHLCKRRSLVMFWTLLCVVATGLGWILAVHSRNWLIDVLAVLSIVRVLFGVWSARSSLLSEV